MSAVSVSAKAAVLHLLARRLAAEYVQAVDEMEHAITVDTIVLIDRAATCRKRAADVALLLQNVKHLEAHGGSSLQEGLGKLRVPDKLIAVHALVRVAAAALIGNISGKPHAPRHGDSGIYSVGEVIRFLIVIRVQLVLLKGVRKTSVQSELQPIVAISPLKRSLKVKSVVVFFCSTASAPLPMV